MPCPDEDTISSFVRGELSSDEGHEVERHLDGCDGCSRVVADLVRIFADDFSSIPSRATDPSMPTVEATLSGATGHPNRDSAFLRAGAEVGRYQVLDCIGFGGMGVVYGAYDPELDRKVALKVLRGTRMPEGRAESRRNSRLLREAQLMARLSHPNVITVHDVGHFEGRVFLAMEYIQGTTMTKWLDEPRSWREIRDVFVAAGQGLAAAHEAGLVHRDFKPDNVLIGEDGRVRVTDFGLARYRAPADSELTTDKNSIDSDGTPKPAPPRPVVPTLTRTGALIGTPAYMAPEQYDQTEVSAATDQFAFCIALYQAITGERPFRGKTVAELASNVTTGKVKPIAQCRAPSKVARAVLRGLSVEPADRFPNMHALLAVLERRPSRVLRRAAVVTVPSLLLAAGVWIQRPSDQPRAGFCAPEHDFEQIWSSRRSRSIRRAFQATNLAYAESTMDRVATAMDSYAVQWSGLRESLCGSEATAEEAARFAWASRCLQQQRTAVEALLDVFEHADPDTVRQAVSAVDALADPRSCNAEPLLQPEPPPPEHRERVEVLQQDLARAKTLENAGKVNQALEIVEAVERTATQIEHRASVAQARYLRGRIHQSLGDYEAARDDLRDAVWIGVEARDRRTTAAAWVHLVFVLGIRLGDLEGAREALRAARAELQSVEDPKLERSLAVFEAGLMFMEKRLEDALEAYQAVLDADPEHPDRAPLLSNIASVQTNLGRNEEALVLYRRAQALLEERLGPRHPDVAGIHYNIALTLMDLERMPEAAVALQTASELEVETLSSHHPRHGQTLSLLGFIALMAERYEESVILSQQAYEILLAHSPPQLKYYPQANLIIALTELRRLDEAQAQVDAMNRHLEAQSEPSKDDRLYAKVLEARVARIRGELDRALELVREVEVSLQTCEGCLPVTRDECYLELGRALLAKDRGDEAAQWLRRALEGDAPSPVRAAIELALARALISIEQVDEGRRVAQEAVSRAWPGSPTARELERVLADHS